MIRWMLARMERSSSAVFYEKELVDRFPRDFDWAKRERLLRRVQTQVDGGTYSLGQSRILTVVSDDGRVEAFDDEDPEAEPIELARTDLARWAVDIDALASRFRDANRLAGKAGALSDRLFLLGEGEMAGVRLAFVLGFIPDPRAGETLLPSLPNLLPVAYDGFVVVAPSFLPAPAEARRLQALGIAVIPLGDPDPFVIRISQAAATPSRTLLPLRRLERAESRFHHSPDYGSAELDGESFSLTARQAQAVQILDEARMNGTPEVGQAFILERLESTYTDLRQVFKKSKAWGRLVVPGKTKGAFRLNL